MPSPLEKTISSSIVKAIRAIPRSWAVKIHGGPYQQALPDICCCVAGRTVWLEVKRPGKKATPIQEAEMAKIRAAGGEAFVVTSKAEAIQILEDWNRDQ